MAIDVHCPFCEKPYRLKDDLAGKRVTCANQDCRKVFTVTPSANGAANGPAKPATPPAAKAPPKPALPPPPPPDAEALAAAALTEDEPAAPEDTRTIEMTCTICEHKWMVPWAMQGKNVLCPDCKTRQKVPEQKKVGKADWRDRRQPSMAKVERLEGVVASQDNTMISGETIREAGLVEVEYEPRPTSFYVKIGLAALAGVVLVVAGVMYSIKSRTERKEEQLFHNVLEALDSPEIKNLPKEVGPLYRAALLIATAEHEARKLDQKNRDEAVKHYKEALGELQAAPKSAERDALYGELAVALLVLGGTDEQVKEHAKLPWVPLPPKNSRAQVKPSQAEAEGVQGQLRRVFEAMKGPIDFDLRAATTRRVARELVRHDQVQMLLDTLQAGFADAEQPEVRGQIGLELLRAGKADKAREVGEALKGDPAVKGAAPPASSVQALWLALDPPITGVSELVGEPTGGEPSDASRLAYAALAMMQKNPDKALQYATKPGKTEGKLRALALAAEYADQPGPFVEEAARLAEREGKKKEPERSLPPGQVMIRLARAAARAGLADKAEEFYKPTVVVDEGLREWAKAEVLREKLSANPGAEAKDEEAAVPDDVKKYRLGHAWARLHLARHNARRTNDRGLATKYRIAWPTNTIAPFGQAGVALGVQDAELK